MRISGPCSSRGRHKRQVGGRQLRTRQLSKEAVGAPGSPAWMRALGPHLGHRTRGSATGWAMQGRAPPWLPQAPLDPHHHNIRYRTTSTTRAD